MSSRKTAGRRGTTKKRAQRATSNVFAMFNQDQIQEFKEAFNMIDQNRDGFIEHDDLRDMLASLGKVGKKHCDVLEVNSNKLHPICQNKWPYMLAEPLEAKSSLFRSLVDETGSELR